MIAARLRTAIARDMADAELEPYLLPWLGPIGQAAYYRQVAQFDERYTREIEPRYGEIRTPTLVLWGEQDGWLAPEFGRRRPTRSQMRTSRPSPTVVTSFPRISPDRWSKRSLPSSRVTDDRPQIGGVASRPQIYL